MEGNRHLGLLIVILFHNLQESVAIDAPAIVSVENEGTTDSLKVTWICPADATAHVVTWSPPHGNLNGASGDLEGTATEYIITGLTPGTLYNVTVTAQNGTSDTNDDSEHGRTKPSPVWNLSESGATNDSISAGWNKPSGAIDQYTFSCSSGTEDPSSPITEVSSNMYQVSCLGLSTAGANYTITVTSQSGNEISDDTTITITAYPNSVVLREGVITTRQITVQWDDPEGEEDSFTVDCGADGSNDITILPDDATNNNFQATCNVSMAGAPYNITVTSVSGDKESPITGTFTAATPEGVTFGESSSSTTSITVTWITLAGADGFRVACSDGAPSHNSPLPGSATEVTCDGVTSGGNHSVSVVTQENNGESPAMVMYVVALPEAVTLNEESNMVTTTTITASWTMPNGIVEYYEVSCSDGTASPDQVNPSDDLIASCTGLSTPGDNYSISVTSVSNGQRSATSTITITALPSAVSLSEGPSNNTAISATWTIPDGVVDTFTIACSAGTASPASIPVESSPTSDTFTAYCIGLPTPGLEYNLSVVAISNKKRSAVQTVGVHTSPTGVELTEGSPTTTSVSVNWAQPESAVESYSISCSSGDASPATIVDTSQPSYTASCVNLAVPGDTYTMTVYSIVDSGTTTTSSSIDLVALPEAVTLNEESNMVTTTTITASWTMPNGIVEYYEVSCPEGTASPDQVDPSDDLIASCTGLSTPGDNYTISVTSVSNGKLSAASTITITALPEAVTLNEESNMVTTTSITASWTIPNGIVEYYEVSCSAGTASPAQVNPSDDLIASCTGLSTLGDNYAISVTSVSNGKLSAASTITITALPSAVSLSEGPSNNTAISATWIIPDGVVDTFNITCSAGTASPASIPVESSPTSDTFTAYCIGLPTPGLEYNLSVVAISNGKLSAVQTVGVHASPTGVDLTEGTPTTTSVSVNWMQPESAVESYSISCSSGVASPSTIEDTSQTYYMASCVNLPVPGDTYTMTVYSIVDSGTTNTSSSILLVALPESVILNEESNMVTTTTITASWTMPNGIVEYYEVSCSDGTASPAQVHPSDDLTASCTGLSTLGDDYSIAVTAVSNGQRSAPSAITITTLPEAVTLNEESNMVTTTTITASWTIPNGIVEYYEVSCSDNGIASPAQVNPSDDLIASCTGLSTPGDNYTIAVTSVSNGKLSAASTITITVLPEAVTLNEESNMVTTNTITASWTMPNGIVEYYEVSCSNGTASPAQVNPLDDLRASCTGLSTPGDDYNIYVTTVSNGQRSETDTITITALPEAVELSPGESNITAISATWTVPNSVVDTFNITCSSGIASPASIPVISSQAGQQLTAYCVGLPKSGEQYDLSVVGISNDKLSAISTIEVVALPLGVDLEEGPSTLTSVNASWMRQEEPVERYSIACSHGDASPSTIEDTNQASFSAACVNLTGPGATYSMTVYNMGTKSSSNSTRASSLIFLVAVPASVESITVTEPTTTTVDVQWNLMQCSDCVYNYFLLNFEPDSQEPIRVDYTTGVNEYSSQVSGLTQGRSYSFTVVSVSGVGVEDATLKTSDEESVDQRTVPATPFGLSILSRQRELNLVWLYQGDADNFTITITPDHGIAVFNGDLIQPAAEITGLTPGTAYDIAIVTVSGDERSEPITETARTLPDKPSPVRNPQAEAVDKNTITLTYESPVEPNGDITSYMISYVGTRDGNPTHEFSDVYGVVLTVTYGDLRAGFSYMFTIIAVNDGAFESDRISTAPVETPQEEPPPVEEDYPYDDNTDFSDTSTTSFAVVLPEDLFSHDNGELLTFAVIITREANDPTVGSTEQNYEEARAQNAYVTAIDIPYPYPPTFGSNRKRRATESSATVVIGEDGTCACSPNEYCNGALDGNTQYYYAFRAYNGLGDVTSSTFGPVTTESTGSSSPNIMSYGGQICLIVVVVALLLYAVAITFLYIQLRRKVPTGTEENGPDLYMDLQPIPDADRTYQEMAITSTASSKRPGERRLPSSHLIYENQHVAQFANKIKGDADYEDVTPN